MQETTKKLIDSTAYALESMAEEITADPPYSEDMRRAARRRIGEMLDLDFDNVEEAATIAEEVAADLRGLLGPDVGIGTG